MRGRHIVHAWDAGYLLYLTKDRAVNIHCLVNIILWLAAITLGLVLVYRPYFHWESWNQIKFYYAYRKAAWGLCLMWVTFACCRGYGGIINSFLSWGFWLPISKVSFMTYLFHLAFNFYFFLLQPYPVTYSMWLVTEWFVGQLWVCLLLGLLGTLTLELPAGKLQKILLQRLARPSGAK